MKRICIAIIIAFAFMISAPAMAQKILIPMDLTQTDHLKAYGVAYWCLTYGQNVEWLLNYRGGSFMTNDLPQIAEMCHLKGVKYENVNGAQEAQIKAT